MNFCDQHLIPTTPSDTGATHIAPVATSSERANPRPQTTITGTPVTLGGRYFQTVSWSLILPIVGLGLMSAGIALLTAGQDEVDKSIGILFLVAAGLFQLVAIGLTFHATWLLSKSLTLIEQVHRKIIAD